MRWRGLLKDWIRGSLFFVPMSCVAGAVVIAQLGLELDGRVGDLPDRLRSTVDSGRAVLSVTASATLGFAAIAFSVSLLLLSMASSQYSPRVVHGLFRDGFNKRVMGVVIGTFTYCLVVMRAVRGPLEESGTTVVPSLSVLLAVVLGITSILAIVAFISHSAHLMDVSRILHRVTEEALLNMKRVAPDETPNRVVAQVPPTRAGLQVMSVAHGWLQQIDHAALLAILQPAGRLRLETVAGRYAIQGTPLCTIWPKPADVDATTAAVCAAIRIGPSRTMEQDMSYGVRQLADVVLKALSPGINDPTTAQDALFHLGVVVRALLIRAPAAGQFVGEDDRVVLEPEAMTDEELIGLAFDEIRVAAVGQPTVHIYVLELLHLLAASLESSDREQALVALRRQAALVVVASDVSATPEADRERVRAAHRKRFDPAS